MRYLGLLIVGIFVVVPLRADPVPVVSGGTPKIEESTSDADKAAVAKAAAEADKWAGAQKKAETPPPAPSPTPVANPAPAPEPAKAAEPATPPTPPPPPAPAAASPSAASLPGMQPAEAAPAPAAKKYVPRPGLNEMQGKILSKSSDPKTLRLLVDGGFNVEFTYDGQTTWVNGGNPITVDDLNYGDVVLIRYAGMDLNAIELDRVSKAPRPQ